MAARQDKFFKNYRYEQVPNRSGKGYKRKCVYIGDYYTWKLSKKEIRSNRLIFGLCEIATLLIYFGVGTIRNELNLNRYVVIPAILALITLIFEVFAMWIFCLGKQPYQEDDFKRMDQTFRITLPARFLILALTSALSCAVTVFLHTGIMGAVITAGYLACSLIAFYLYLKYKKMQVFKVVASEHPAS